jgi:hypothetical protein
LLSVDVPFESWKSFGNYFEIILKYHAQPLEISQVSHGKSHRNPKEIP